MSIKIQFEIGHTAMLKSKKTIDNFTHDWELYVRGIDKADISTYIDKIVFNLHESFPKPKRTVKEPPYILKESGYAGFIIPIDIYFKNRHMQKFNYDLELQQNGPPVHKSEIKKHIFENPSDDFRQKLIKGGGIFINNDEKNRDSSDEYKQLLNKPKFNSSDSSSLSKKHKIRQDKNKEPTFATFANLFGTPIQKQPLPSSLTTIVNNSGINVVSSGSNSSNNSKVSPDSKSKSSPIVGSVSSAGTLTSNKTNSSKLDKGYNPGQSSLSNLAQQQQQSSISSSSGGNNHINNSKDKYEKSDKKDKQNKHNSPHKDKNNSSNNNKDGKKDDKHDRRNDRKKDKSHSKERDRSHEKNSKQRLPSPQLRQHPQQQGIASPLLPRKFSPLRNSSKEDSHNRKNKNNISGNSGNITNDLDIRKSESKKSKKDKKSHDKDKIRDRRDKERSTNSINDIQKNKDSHHTTTKLTNLLSNNRIDSTSGANISISDNNKLDYNKSKDSAGSLLKIQSIKKDNKFTTDNYQPTTSNINLEKRISDNVDKDEKRHKHKKKDKVKDKEKSLSRLNKDEIIKKNKEIDNLNISTGSSSCTSSKNQKYSNNNLQIQGNNDTNSINNNVALQQDQQPQEPELSESESIANSDIEIQTTTTETLIKQQKIINHSDSSTNSYKDIVHSSRLKSLQQSQQLSGSIITTTIPNTNSNKKDRKSKENKQSEKDDKKRKRKSREETDLIIAAKKPNSPIGSSSNSLSLDQQQSSIPKYMKKTDIKTSSSSGTNSGTTVDSTNIFPTTTQPQQHDSFRTPTNNVSSYNNNIHSNHNNLQIRTSGTITGSTMDYMSELRELQKKIMKLQDSNELQQVVEMIAATGRYEVTSKTFDFDLCALDRNTVQRLQDFFAATSIS